MSVPGVSDPPLGMFMLTPGQFRAHFIQGELLEASSYTCSALDSGRHVQASRGVGEGTRVRRRIIVHYKHDGRTAIFGLKLPSAPIATSTRLLVGQGIPRSLLRRMRGHHCKIMKETGLPPTGNVILTTLRRKLRSLMVCYWFTTLRSWLHVDTSWNQDSGAFRNPGVTRL